MTVLTDYNNFSGRHWETGSVQNFYAYRGVKAPHNDEPISEALLLGVSGGAVFGYFSFAYEGWDPFVALLTRNTFDPYQTMLSRLGVMQNVKRTASADKGRKNLLDCLDEGTPAIVMADHFALEYNASDLKEMWGMFPLVCYGLDETTAFIADSAGVGLTVSAEQFAQARAKVKKEKHQIMTLEAPDFSKLTGAVKAGIWDTIKLYTEKPPKGGKNSFGFNAYSYWIKLLTQPKQRQSWEKVFPAGRKMFSALLSSFERTATFGQPRCGADRHNYADFLDEAATILEQPILNDAAVKFRDSAQAWCAMADILLPNDIDLFREARALSEERRDKFYNEGNASIERRYEINKLIDGLKDSAESSFPLDQAGVEAHRARIADQVRVIHEIEREAVTLMQHAMG